MSLPSSIAPVPLPIVGVPFLLALFSFQVECRLPPKVLVRGVEKALYGDSGYPGRLSIDPNLSRKEVYRGRKRRKRRPLTNYIHNSYGYHKKARSRPRRPPPPVHEFPEDFEDLGEEPGYTEERPVRTRPWSSHLYSASIRSREPPRGRPEYYPKFRGGKKPRPKPIGGHYINREPEELDNRWNDYREEYPSRIPEWELEDQPYESDRVRNYLKGDFPRSNGKHHPWRDNREVLRTQNFKNPHWNDVDVREVLGQTQQMPSYQMWGPDDPRSPEDMEVQVKYPVWMDDSKSEDWSDTLFPGQRVKNKFHQDSRAVKQRPALNQDLEAHVIQPAKTKVKFRSGIGQNIRGQPKEVNWELELPYNTKSTDLNWEEPKPFENHDPQWPPEKVAKWNPKKSGIKSKGNQWDEGNNYNQENPWSETSSVSSNQDQHWQSPDSTTSSSQAYPHWDNSQKFYHDRSLRQQIAAAQAKIDQENEDHDDHDSELKPIGSQ